MSSSPSNDRQRSSLDLRCFLESGLSPRTILQLLAPDIVIPSDADDATIARLIISMHEPPKRDKLQEFNTLDDAVDLIRKSKKILVLSGAGVSTSAGLPDFRSRNGIYKQIHEKHPDLRDPKSMFDIKYFRKNPQPFYQFAKALFPGQYKPAIGHYFIKSIEEHGKLLNNYTQNIDTLEKQAGIKRVVECHGSFSKATCTSCRYGLDGEYLRKDILEQRIPICPLCHTSDDGPQDGLGIMKPNIVFFGEQLGNDFHDTLDKDKDQADLLIVIGSSLKVRPVALIPSVISSDVPQILINKEPLDNFNFDIELYGNCDDIIQEICLRLGDKWTKICRPEFKPLKQLIGPDGVKISGAQIEHVGSQPAKSDSKETGSGDVKPVPPPVVSLDVTDEQSNQDSKTQINDSDSKAKSDQESDWVDASSNGSSDASDSEAHFQEKIDLVVPESSFIFIEPNKYIFNGAEMTRSQFKRIKDD